MAAILLVMTGAFSNLANYNEYYALALWYEIPCRVIVKANLLLSEFINVVPQNCKFVTGMYVSSQSLVVSALLLVASLALDRQPP